MACIWTPTSMRCWHRRSRPWWGPAWPRLARPPAADCSHVRPAAQPPVALPGPYPPQPPPPLTPLPIPPPPPAPLSLSLDLIRWNRPAGWLVCLWPTLSALWVAADGFPGWHLLLVFVLGTCI